EVIHTELRAGLTLLGRAKGSEAEDIPGFLVQKLCKAALEVVVRSDVVEDGLLYLERREVSPPTEGLRLRETEGRLVKLDGASVDRELGYLACKVFGDPLLQLKPREVGTQ